MSTHIIAGSTTNRALDAWESGAKIRGKPRPIADLMEGGIIMTQSRKSPIAYGMTLGAGVLAATMLLAGGAAAQKTINLKFAG
jgi:hypothetical protein